MRTCILFVVGLSLININVAGAQDYKEPILKELEQLCSEDCSDVFTTSESEDSPNEADPDGAGSIQELFANAACFCSTNRPGSTEHDHRYSVAKTYTTAQVSLSVSTAASQYRNNSFSTVCTTWRKAADTATTRRPIINFPGYTSVTHSGLGTYNVTSTFKFKPNNANLARGTYYIYFAHETRGGDVITRILRLIIT